MNTAVEIFGTIKVEQRKLAALVPFARNSRTHSDAQVAQITASIREFGWTNPILIDERGGVIAGHGRLLAAKALGMDEAPCIELRGLSEAQKRAYVIADNNLALNAGWDEDLLASELQSLTEDGFDLSLLGFSEGDLADLLADRTEGLTDPDEVPEAPADPVSVLGDVWLLGKHRIACGDSTDAAVVAAVLDGVKPHLMVTDPPYGVEYDPSWREVWALFPGDVAYVWHGGLHAQTVAESLTASGFELRSQIIWNKGRAPISRSDYHWQHEPCWYVVRKGKTGHYNGDRKQRTVWDIANNDGANHAREEATIHGTQKPVECMKRPIENNSSPGQAVYEPFSGSGTTIIAGEMTGRAVHAIELNPAYVDVAVIRWQQFTGEDAAHAETGQTFAQAAAERAEATDGE